MKTLLICASNSLMSINGRIMDRVMRETAMDFLYLSKYPDIPMFNRDLLDLEEIPKEIHEIHRTLKFYETLVFFAPEHNGYLASFFKNILDWISVVELDFLKGKRVYLVSVSPTNKEIRIMEDAVEKTFNMFSPKEFKFINFPDYGTEHDSKNTAALMDKIFRKSR